MVGTSSAGGVLHDAPIVAEELVGNLEGNGDGSLGQGLQMGTLTPGDGGVSGDLVCLGTVGSAAGFAGSVRSSVGHGGGSGNSATILGTPVVAVAHPSTVTSVPPSLIDTVQVLLLGEVPEDTTLLLVVGLKTSDSSESPARSTRSLVLDGGNISGVGPENLLGGVEALETSGSGSHLKSRNVESKVALFLHGGHEGELVDSVLGRILDILVVVGNLDGSAPEQSESEGILGSSEVKMVLNLHLLEQSSSGGGGPQDGPEGILGKGNSQKANQDNLHLVVYCLGNDGVKDVGIYTLLSRW